MCVCVCECARTSIFYLLFYNAFSNSCTRPVRESIWNCLRIQTKIRCVCVCCSSSLAIKILKEARETRKIYFCLHSPFILQTQRRIVNFLIKFKKKKIAHFREHYTSVGRLSLCVRGCVCAVPYRTVWCVCLVSVYTAWLYNCAALHCRVSAHEKQNDTHKCNGKIKYRTNKTSPAKEKYNNNHNKNL